MHIRESFARSQLTYNDLYFDVTTEAIGVKYLILTMSGSVDVEVDVDLNEILNSDNEEFVNDPPVSHRKKPKKRSFVWEQYDEIVEDGLRYSICKLCVDK